MELKTLKFTVSGMNCMSCVGRVEKALLATPGVKRALVDLKKAMAEVQVDATKVDATKLCAAIGKAGYQATSIDTVG